MPGVKAVCFSDIDEHSKINESLNQKIIGMMSAIIHMNRERSITKEQYEKFIDKLSAKIRGQEHIQLKDMSSYHPSVEVVESFKEAGEEEVSPFWLFPFKTMMEINANDKIFVNYKQIESSYYTSSLEPKEESFISKLMLLRQEFNIHTDVRDISSAVLAEYDLVEKCKDPNFDDSYSKEELIKLNLYP